jgi:two-component system phosphate regulon sensor histidine kinase PhoR
MKLAIRWQLMGSYLLLLVLVVGALYAYLRPTLERQLVDGVRDSLRSEAGLVALMASQKISDLRADAPVVAAQVGERVRARVTIVAANGEVAGDSEVAAANLATLENHRDRPEVSEAQQVGFGSAMRYSTTVHTQMLYVAVPGHTVAGEQLVVRLALPLAVVDRARASLHTVLGMALALAVLLSLVLSYLLSRFTSRTLNALAAGAARFGSGDFATRLPVRSRDELGELARVMNEMAGRLEGEMDRLATERNRLDAILRGMGEGLLVTDAAGVVTLINPAFRTLFELDAEPVGRPLAEVSRHPALLETFRRMQASRAEQIAELVLPRVVEVTLLTHWVPLPDGGGPAGAVAVFHDISDLKRLERVRRDFVANVSHELRTPITVIRGYAETLADAAADQQVVARFAAIIQSHAERLAALVSDLLTLSELEAKGAALALSPLALPEVVAHCRNMLDSQVAARGVDIEVDAVPPLTVLADRQRLEQVLVNLLDNAVKYAPVGGKITVSAEAEGDFVRVSVRDNGAGIPHHEQTRIFERFYRVDAGRSREQGGTGLGLAIVRHIVQLHGGTVGVNSIPGQGAEFYFTLQREQGSAGPLHDGG